MGGTVGRVALAAGTGGLSELGGVRTAIDAYHSATAPTDPLSGPVDAATAARYRASSAAAAGRVAGEAGTTQLLDEAAKAQGNQAIDLSAEPAPTPDLTDEAVKRARINALMSQQGAGISSTFLTGPLGAAAPSLAPPGLK